MPQVRLDGWHAKHSSVLELGSVTVSASNRCVLRLQHVKRSDGMAPHRPSKATSESNSKFKILSVIVPPFDMNGRAITDLKHGEVNIENAGPVK